MGVQVTLDYTRCSNNHDGWSTDGSHETLNEALTTAMLQVRRGSWRYNSAVKILYKGKAFIEFYPEGTDLFLNDGKSF